MHGVGPRGIARQNAPKAKLAGDFGGNDRLGTWFGKGTLDPMERERRVAHAAHDHSFLVI